MNARKTAMTALAATLLVSASYGAVFAKDGKPGERGPDRKHHHQRMNECGPRSMMMHGRAAMFIYALQQFDTNKDGKISKDEAKAAEDKLFAAIDTNKDGVLTPGELRKFHEARMEAWKAEMSKPPAKDDKAKGADDAAAPADGNEAMNGPMDGMMGGPMDDCAPHERGHHDRKWRAMHDAMRGGHEGRHGWRPMMEMGMMGPMGLLGRIDTDENGQISKAEADTALNTLFTRLDANKDSFISADDFPKAPPLLP